MTDQILKQHNIHVAQLGKQLQYNKERQEKIITEKINNKKMQLQE